MSNLINRMRLQAEDLHVINPTCETVKCLSLGADRITQLEALIREVAIPRISGLLIHAAFFNAEFFERWHGERRKREKLANDVERCYRMLLSEPDTKGALFKAENILREALAEAKAATHNAIAQGREHSERPSGAEG